MTSQQIYTALAYRHTHHSKYTRCPVLPYSHTHNKYTHCNHGNIKHVQCFACLVRPQLVVRAVYPVDNMYPTLHQSDCILSSIALSIQSAPLNFPLPGTLFYTLSPFKGSQQRLIFSKNGHRIMHAPSFFRRIFPPFCYMVS